MAPIPTTRRLLLLFAVGNLLFSTVLCSRSASSNSLFGVRGGAFFGFGRNGRKSGENGGGGDDDIPKRYPALTQEEIEDKLNIPVFGLTDGHGNGVILSGDKGNNIFHFFFSKHMADAALSAVVSSNPGCSELRVSAFHLGKCWFKLINKSGSMGYKLQKYNGKEGKRGNEVTRPVHFRLVPNMKDLMGARILTGLKPGDVEELKDAVEEPNPPKALSIIQNAANSETSSFTSPFDEIPVFAIAQMRVRQKDDHGMPIGENMMPFHLSTKTMSDTWNHFIQQSPQFEDAEATLQLVELHKMIDMMQHESDFDWRGVCFILPQYDKDEKNVDREDSDDDSEDGGGGGDNGMKATENVNNFEGSIEPFVSMEVFVDGPDRQTLVPM